MPEGKGTEVAIVDYGMGNLFSVQLACEQAGLKAEITSSPKELDRADAVILPGVGAFGAAMETLKQLHLTQALERAASSGKPLFGICLGMQLFMSRSLEFGTHEGLNLIPGEVVSLQPAERPGRRLKVPEVGWNRIFPAGSRNWNGTFLEGLAHGEYQYFVHSFVCRPEDPEALLAKTAYGPEEFCSCVQWKNLFACQFHPERSGPAGLRIYKNWASHV
ncbi:MAG: imidazole glycerol phosphate synthase subunit HisH [Candidatus Omnitrophica bacterium]|nr:imidazole glycerol phosphate synthase subunit HisH [Candidatus Omnitrophota bacterium]